MSAAAQAAVGENYEIVLVDDGSSDRTWQHMRDLTAGDQHLAAVRLSRNHGHQLALSAGLDLCRGELIFIIDADLQDPPELLGAMVERLRAEDADVVHGMRIRRHGETLFKRSMTKAFYRLLAVATDGVEIPLDTGDCRLITRRVLDVLRQMPEQPRFIRGMVAWAGFRQAVYEYERDPRLAGETHYPFGKLMRLAFDGLTGFSSAPLRLASYAGMVFTVIAALLIVYALLQRWAGHPIEGWTSLMIVVLVIGSVQLLVLGVMGEYIARLYSQAKDRPAYIVREIAGRSLGPPTLGVVSLAAERPGSV